MSQEKLQEILEKHKKWLNKEQGGERADLSGCDLRHTDLRGADLRGAYISDSNLIGADLFGADLQHADLSHSFFNQANLRNSDLHYADLRYADLCNSDLRYSDLQGTDLDFSCLPLWCGSLSAHFDDRQLIQIAYHLVKAGLHSKNASDETKRELSKLIDFANTFHRVDECGKIERMIENDKD